MPYILEHTSKGYLRKRTPQTNCLVHTPELQKAQLFEEASHAQNLLASKFKRNPKKLIDYSIKAVTIVEKI
jgi:hypothetical protein